MRGEGEKLAPVPLSSAIRCPPHVLRVFTVMDHIRQRPSLSTLKESPKVAVFGPKSLCESPQFAELHIATRVTESRDPRNSGPLAPKSTSRDETSIVVLHRDNIRLFLAG